MWFWLYVWHTVINYVVLITCMTYSDQLRNGSAASATVGSSDVEGSFEGKSSLHHKGTWCLTSVGQADMAANASNDLVVWFIGPTRLQHWGYPFVKGGCTFGHATSRGQHNGSKWCMLYIERSLHVFICRSVGSNVKLPRPSYKKLWIINFDNQDGYWNYLHWIILLQKLVHDWWKKGCTSSIGLHQSCFQHNTQYCCLD